ncbi:MAG: hypothetical protein AAGA02_00935 [Bacteroidota bacterium]
MSSITTRELFILLLLGLYILLYAADQLILNAAILEETLLYEGLSLNKIKELLEFKKDWNWINYVSLPLILSLKLGLISFWILCGSILVSIKISLREIFRVVLVAEFIWLIPSFISIVWFGVISTNFTLQDVQNFQPLSMLNLFDVSNVEPWLIFALRSINLFELFYIMVLALGMMKITNHSYSKALKLTFPVYGSALLTWIVFVTFLTINLT